uniref:NADH-ubiquinone oxidoreductase chain 6 n=1 Tax=Echinaster brasiliensis TaxID=1681203 RepID=A0A343XBL7_9ECHI|nr:NADH dehydrogenase subunit 6 [Echinaster brasiliensis]AWK29631.1 NADH dehydrogenase subunit 6 [Echinaster brasiliensis]
MVLYFDLVVILLGSTFVFYSLSPYYGALGLVLVAGGGCFLLGVLGLSFIALVLLLIYLGGMMVVFLYSTALSAERYPVVSGLSEILLLGGLMIFWAFFNFGEGVGGGLVSWTTLGGLDLIGSGWLFDFMGVYLVGVGYVLLVALMVALVITYGSSFSVLKAL